MKSADMLKLACMYNHIQKEAARGSKILPRLLHMFKGMDPNASSWRQIENKQIYSDLMRAMRKANPDHNPVLDTRNVESVVKYKNLTSGNTNSGWVLPSEFGPPPEPLMLDRMMHSANRKALGRALRSKDFPGLRHDIGSY
jgi:hypothetical protein